VRRLERCNEPAGWQPVPFGMALDVSNGRVLMRLSGDADASVATSIDQVLRDAVLHTREARDVDVVLADVTFLDGRVVGVLLGVRDELRAQGRAFALVAPSAPAARLLGILGLDRVVDIRDADPSMSTSERGSR
jgi:anti-anti-sigma factor